MLRTIMLATALVLTPVAAFADLAISGQDGKQVRAGDGLPMVPTPDSVAAIEFSSSKAPRVIGMLNVCSTQMGPPSAWPWRRITASRWRPARKNSGRITS